MEHRHRDLQQSKIVSSINVTIKRHSFKCLFMVKYDGNRSGGILFLSQENVLQSENNIGFCKMVHGVWFDRKKKNF